MTAQSTSPTVCIGCIHHRINPSAHSVLCNHPNLGIDQNTPGVPARYVRERWLAGDDPEFIRSQFKNGLCGREGEWFEPQS